MVNQLEGHDFILHTYYTPIANKLQISHSLNLISLSINSNLTPISLLLLLLCQGLEQEKHNLRQKLLLAEDDGDIRVLELQADLKELSKRLEAQEHNVRQAEREKTALLDELTQQNQRLTVQLQEANQLEVQLNVQLQEVRDQYSQRNTSLQVREISELFT